MKADFVQTLNLLDDQYTCAQMLGCTLSLMWSFQILMEISVEWQISIAIRWKL